MKKLIKYLTVLFLILSCNSVYCVAVNRNYYINEILLVFVCLLFIFHISSSNFNKKNISKTILFCILHYVYIFIFVKFNSINGLKSFLYLFCILFPLLYFMYKTSKENKLALEIIEIFPRIMTFLAIISLLFYFFGSLMNIISPSGTMGIKWNGVNSFSTYFGVHFNLQSINLFGTRFIRNTGIFTEAPMYSLNLTIALALELFICVKKSRMMKSILVLTIFTTFSTTGIVLTCIMLILSWLLEKDKNVIKRTLKIFLLPIVTFLLALVGLYFLNTKQQTSSYLTRIDDYRASFFAWKNHLMFGNGYQNTTAIVYYMDNFRKDNLGLSNSILVLLAQCGIYLFVFYLIPAFKTIKYGLKTRRTGISIFSMIMILLFITTIFQYKPLLIHFLAVGFALPKKGEELNE